jgi:molecular chaperone DnaK
MTYQIGVDVGATFTTAAVCRGGRAEVVRLGSRIAPVPSVAFAGADRSLVFGEEAERHALPGAGRVARLFTRRIGDSTPLLVGGSTGVPVTADVLTARLVAHVVSAVAARLGGAPTDVAVTHPAGWGHHRLSSLRAALTATGLGTASFLSTAQAAATADRGQLPGGGQVAVYDLGGSRLDAAVVRMTEGRFTPVGQPEELEVGGLDLDELVFGHVLAALGDGWTALDSTDPAVLAGVARLRRSCTVAKEILSADTDTWIPVALPGIDTSVRFTRLEFEELARPAIEETAAVLARVVEAAGPDAVLLTGGSARIPLVTQVVSAQLGRPVTVAADPRCGTAIGAALAVGRPADVVEPTRVALRGVPAPVAAVRPPRPPVAAVVPPAASRRARPRTILTAGAALVTAAAAALAVALANYSGPSDADADPERASTTVPTVTVTSTPPAETVTAPAPREQDPPPRVAEEPEQNEEPAEPVEEPTTSVAPETTPPETTAPETTTSPNVLITAAEGDQP